MAERDHPHGGEPQSGAITEAPSATRGGRAWFWLAGLSLAVLVGAACWATRSFWCATDPDGAAGGDPAPAPETASGLIDDSPRRACRELADRIVRDFPESAAAMHARGWLLVRWGDRAEAVRCWETSVKMDSNFAPPHHWLGKEAIRQGDYQRAVPLLRRAMELDPNRSGIGLELGTSLLKTNRIEEAIEVLEKHLARSPGTLEAYYLLGQALLHVGALDKAKQCYEAAVRADPNSSRAYFGLATVCTRIGEMEKARQYRNKVEECKKAERDDVRRWSREYDSESDSRQEMADEYTYAGRIYLEHGKVREAQELWQKAAASDPGHAQSRKLLATVLQQQDKNREALEVLKELRRIEPDNPVHCLNAGVLHQRLEQYDAAEEAFRKAAELGPKRSDAQAALARLHLVSGRKLPEARACAQKAVQLTPNAANYSLLGTACFRNGDFAAALAAMRRAMDLDPGNAEYRETYRYIQQQQSQPKP